MARRTTTITATSALLLALLACNDAAPRAPAPAAPAPTTPAPSTTAAVTTPPDQPVSAQLQVVHDHAALVATCTVKNLTASPIWVLDTVIDKDAPSERAIVSRGDPGTARLVLGYLSPQSQMPQIEQGVGKMVAPIATELAAGASRTRTVRIALPIHTWHPYLEMAPLRDPRELVLEVGYLTSEPPWSPRELAGGRVPTVAHVHTAQQWARSQPVPLPGTK